MSAPGAPALLTTAQMARADAATIASGTAGAVLMEAAGAVVAGEIERRWSARPATVLCGPGNNGGDGFVVARLLAGHGWDVTVATLKPVARLRGDAARMAALWTGPTGPLGVGALDRAAGGLVVDAMFGAGLSRPLAGPVAEVARAIAGRGLTCVAVDIPSGIHGDSGAILGAAVKAALTVTFFRRKPGHLLLPGRGHCGRLVTADIGIPASVLRQIGPRLWENTPAAWLPRFPWPRLDGHKYDRGHAVVIGGGPTQAGAARLAARAALRVGAGLVTLAGPPAALSVNAGHLTTIMTAVIAGAGDLRDFLGDKRRNAVLVGPGNGVGEATRVNVLAALAADKPCVLDADALTSFGSRPDELFQAIKGGCLLTPHGGEFRRLFGELTADFAAAPSGPDKVALVRAAAALSGATVLLKGADTVIAAVDGRAVINCNAPPELATAGAGDVLAGLALGLMAQGMDEFDAGCAAAWLHGEAATAFGPGLIAEDIPEILPQVLGRLRSSRAS